MTRWAQKSTEASGIVLRACGVLQCAFKATCYLGDPLRRARLLSDETSKRDIGNGPFAFGGDAYKRLMHSRMDPRCAPPRPSRSIQMTENTPRRGTRKREEGRGHLKMRRKRGEEKGRRRERWALGLTFKVPRVSKAKDANARGRKEGRKRAGFRGALTIARNFQMNGARGAKREMGMHRC